MQSLFSGMRYLCDETRMLSCISVAYGTANQCESALWGRAQEVLFTPNGFIPCVRPLEEDALYDLASLTKLFTCVMTLLLLQRGQLSLDESVGQIDKRFIHLRDVRVGSVLGFCTSLQTPARIDTAPDRDQALERLFSCAVCETPAIRVYSDINAMIMKYVVEAKCGLPFGEALRQHIFLPLGLTHTFSHVPPEALSRCVCYNYEHRIMDGAYQLRTDTPPGTAHDPKALILSCNGDDLCGHAGLFSTRQDMVRFAQALLSCELLSPELLSSIGVNRTGFSYGDGTYRQYLGYLCFAKHPLQRLSEVPCWMRPGALGLSGFTGNHLSIDPQLGRFVLFLGNRCHARVSHIAPFTSETPRQFGLREDGVGDILWPDGRYVPSSARYVYFKDAWLHTPIEQRMRQLGWL